MSRADVRFVERLLVLLLVTAVFAWIAYQAWGFPRLARVFPQTVSVAALVLCAAELVRMLWVRWRRGAKGDEETDEEHPGLFAQVPLAIPYLLWILALYGGIYLFGFIVASGLFVFLFTTIVGGMRWYKSLIATGLLLGFIIGFGDVLNLYWPSGAVETWFGIDLP